MARRVAGAGKHHGPGHVAHAPNHLGIDEVGDAAEEQPEGRRRRGDVAKRQRVDALGAGEEIDGGDDAEQSAVEGHATVPHRGNLERVRPEIARLVEQNEAEPAAEHDAERDPQQKIVGLAYGHRRLAVPQIGPRQEIAPIEPAEQDAGHIGEAVPADGERPDLERDRIDDGVGDRRKAACGPEKSADGRGPFTASP